MKDPTRFQQLGHVERVVLLNAVTRALIHAPDDPESFPYRYSDVLTELQEGLERAVLEVYPEELRPAPRAALISVSSMDTTTDPFYPRGTDW